MWLELLIMRAERDAHLFCDVKASSGIQQDMNLDAFQ